MTAGAWLAIIVIIPTLSFCITLYAPSVSHAVQNSLNKMAARKVADDAGKLLSERTADNVKSAPDAVGELPGGSSNLPNPNAPLTIQSAEVDHVPLTLVVGGTAGSRRSPIREGVEDFVRQAGATAGLNGTFFANASLEGTDNLLIGPSLCDNDDHIIDSPFDRRPALNGRPMVLMSEKRTVIVPYQVGLTDDEDTLRGYLPYVKDAFLGGVWLVHNGQATDANGIAAFAVKDAEDPRRRAFFGVMQDGRPMLGATRYVASSAELAQALQSIGVQEAVLLDSGFSTSLVFQNKILVTGHTAPGIPSRPVPQALVLYGDPDPGSVRLAESMKESVATGFAVDVVASRRHHRRKPAGPDLHVTPSIAAPAPNDTPPAPAA